MIELVVGINYKATHSMSQNCCFCKIKNPGNTWKGIILTPVAQPIKQPTQIIVGNKV